MRAQNLKRESTSGKNGRQPRSEAAVLEVEQTCHTRPLVETDLKNSRGGLVGVNARRREQPNEAIGLYQVRMARSTNRE